MKYLVDNHFNARQIPGLVCRVYNDDAPMGPVLCYCHDQADAERIARALSLLDQHEERDRQITEAMQGMGRG